MATQSASLERVVSAFRSVCGENSVSLGDAIREQHGKDESVHRLVTVTLLFIIYIIFCERYASIRFSAVTTKEGLADLILMRFAKMCS